MNVVALATGDGCSGYADAASWKASDVDPAAVAREAGEKAARTAGADDPGPATYRAVLEPYAFGELLWYFGYSSLGALALLEERSYLAEDRRADLRPRPRSTTTRSTRPGSRRRSTSRASRGASPSSRTAWRRSVDRRTAARAGRESTGHALVAPAQSYGPQPFNLSVPAGDASLDELVSRVEAGIYVTRLHYLNIVDPREGLITGMTRDGTFRIEGGKVTRPLVNLRFTTSFPALVASVLGFGDEVRLVNQSDFYGERYPFGALVPAIATEAFTVGIGQGRGRTVGRTSPPSQIRQGRDSFRPRRPRPSVDQIEEPDRRAGEEARDGDREPRQVSLDDVLAALRGRREAEPPKPVSRPECMSTRVTSEIERITWTAATRPSMPSG